MDVIELLPRLRLIRLRVGNVFLWQDPDVLTVRAGPSGRTWGEVEVLAHRADAPFIREAGNGPARTWPTGNGPSTTRS
jgi:hypothetical protein